MSLRGLEKGERHEVRLFPGRKRCYLRCMEPRAYVYVLASRRNGTLYVGSTTDLARRVFEHKQKVLSGFTSRYDVVRLVWYESYDRILDARHREYAIKRWKRAWKLARVESMNPTWRDLDWELIG